MSETVHVRSVCAPTHSDAVPVSLSDLFSCFHWLAGGGGSKDAKRHLLRRRRLRVLSRSYANVKKCSNEGRALMQLDFQQFLMKLEKLTDLRPIPDKEFVETYIKAYYLTENDMEQFIKNHRVSPPARLSRFSAR